MACKQKLYQIDVSGHWDGVPLVILNLDKKVALSLAEQLLHSANLIRKDGEVRLVKLPIYGKLEDLSG